MSRDASLDDLSFQFYTDSGLTSLFSNIYQLTHETDLSDNPQDFVLYFGSPLSNRRLQTVSNPGVDNITLTPGEQLPVWSSATVVALGYTIEPTSENGTRWVVVTAGTTGGSEPDFSSPGGIGSQVSDNGVVWEYVGDTHEPTELTLALSASDLPGNTAGAALALGTTIDSGAANAVEVHIRVENAVDNISNNTGSPELVMSFNSIAESATTA